MGKELTSSSGDDNELEAAVRSCMKKIGDVFNAIRSGDTELVAPIGENLGLFRRRITISPQHKWTVGRAGKLVLVKGPEGDRVGQSPTWGCGHCEQDAKLNGP